MPAPPSPAPFGSIGKATLDASDLSGRDRVERRSAAALEEALSILYGVLVPDSEPADRHQFASRVTNGLDAEARAALLPGLTAMLVDATGAGVTAADRQFDAIAFSFDSTAVNTDAQAWARRYSGDLLRGITDTTRAALRQALDNWIVSGAPLDDLKRTLDPLFGKARAERIAVTEVTRAYAEGNRLAWEASGIVTRRRWQTARDERVCPICGPLSGKTAGLRESFPGGYSGPPAHVSCRCWIAPVVD